MVIGWKSARNGLSRPIKLIVSAQKRWARSAAFRARRCTEFALWVQKAPQRRRSRRRPVPGANGCTQQQLIPAAKPRPGKSALMTLRTKNLYKIPFCTKTHPNRPVWANFRTLFINSPPPTFNNTSISMSPTNHPQYHASDFPPLFSICEICEICVEKSRSQHPRVASIRSASPSATGAQDQSCQSFNPRVPFG